MAASPDLRRAVIRKRLTPRKLPTGFASREDLRTYVTPRLLRESPIHRWFTFPHSFSAELVDEVLRQYPVGQGGRILDPFVGAGTVLVRAKEHGVSATGCDLSPLSVFVSRVKLENFSDDDIDEGLKDIFRPGGRAVSGPPCKDPPRIERAFCREELEALQALKSRINRLRDPVRSFFILALLRVQQRLSRAVPDGGWFRWIHRPNQASLVLPLFHAQVALQRQDLNPALHRKAGSWQAVLQDAREVGQLGGSFDALITSPPYPNRHDYSRIFHMELLALGASEEQITAFRHTSIRSHVEARSPTGTVHAEYESPTLRRTLKKLPLEVDQRVLAMLRGYFDDMYLFLKSTHTVLAPSAPAVLVVGNVRHSGVMIPVDEILVELASQTRFGFEAGWVARLRGNSAQQMKEFGRMPSRETILVFKRT